MNKENEDIRFTSEVHHRRAEELGLKIVGYPVGTYSVPKSYSHYLLPCGHTQDIKHCHVNSEKFRCRSCLVEKYDEDAAACDLKIVDYAPTDDADYKLYKHSACGHEILYATYNVAKKKHINCSVCLTESRFDKAEELGLELLKDQSEKWMYREYRFKSCGHTQFLKLQDVMRGLVAACRTCRDARTIEEAENRGLTLLEFNYESINNEREYKNLYKLPCGCTKALKSGNVRRDVWACDTHSHLGKDSTLYVLEIISDFDTVIKVGKASDLPKRISSINFKDGVHYEVLYESPTSSGAEILKIEQAIHKKFEKINLDHNYAKSLMDNGWTECYPIRYKSEILQEIRRVFNEQ
jgi:hypothetical protein